jgi:hypothetical protein
MSGSSKSSSAGACIDHSCYAQVVYGTDHPECFGALPGELWMLMTGTMFESPPEGLNECIGYGAGCECPMQPGCYRIEDQEAFEVGEYYEMPCIDI